MLHPLSSVRGRIIAGFAFLVLILVGVAAGSAWQVHKHQSDSATMEEHADTAFMLQNALVNAEAAASGLQRYVMIGGETPVVGDEDLLPGVRSDMAEAEESLTQAIADTEARGDREQAARLYQISAEAASLVAGVEIIIALQQSGDAQAAAAGLEVAVLPFREFEDKLEAAAETELQEMSALRSQADRAGDLALWLLIISGATGAVLGLATSVFVARSIIKPLSSLEEAAVAVSQGDLEARAQTTGPRELAHLGSALNQMTESLLDASKRRELEEALRENEARFRALVESAFEGIVISDDGKILEANESFATMFGYEPPEVAGLSPLEMTTPESAELIMKNIQSGFEKPYEITGVKKDGTTFDLEVVGKSCLYQDRSARITAFRDITEIKRAEEALRESEARFRSTLDDMMEGCQIIGFDWRYLYVNDAAVKHGRRAKEELLGHTMMEIFPGIESTEMFAHLRRCMEKRVPQRTENEFTYPNGDKAWFELSIEPAPEGVFILSLDISERKRAEEMIEHLAYHDALTGLPNRTLFEDRLAVTLAQARRKKQMAAVMFLDLDRFKVVNDTVGHTLGDQLLQSVAERLTGLMREGDTVARVGGDEFTLLLPEVARSEDLVEVAERILEALRQPWVLDGHEFRITTSIGIATYPTDGEDAQSLLRNADTAMYRAKDQGRDNYKLYTPKMNARIAERLALENGLRHGLERGEFLVYYQPQVDIASGAISGVEALVRWQHPERGLVSPAEFIQVAEETGLIVPVGAWVLRTACAQAKAWQAAGYPPVRVAVNLSARQFQQRDLIEVVDEVLKETGLEARWLQLEITEGVAMQDVEFNIAVLRELREMGVQIAIDDFGTGHSSLSYLSQLPIDVVKIDQSFIQDLTTDPNDAAIARSIIVMAHNLKLRVIAEGVETEEQLAFLKKRRCDEMQGYLFSKPAPAEAFEEMLRQGGRTSRARRPVEASR